MKKLADYQGDEAIDIVFDITEAIVPFVKDKDVMKIWKEHSILEGFKAAKDKYPEGFKKMLAIYSNIPIEEFNPTAVEVTLLLSTIVTDPIMLSFFASPKQTKGKKSSTSATANSEAKA